MPVHSPDVDDLILAVHSAALAPDGWGQLGRVLLNVVSAEKGIALRVNTEACPEPWALLLNFDPNAATAYAQHWGQHDIWYQGALQARRFNAGLVSVDSQYVASGELMSSVFFNDYLKPLDIRHMIQVCLSGSELDDILGRRAVLSMYRGVAKDPFSAENVRLLSHLAPHLVVATKNYWTAQSLRLMTNARATALDAVTLAVFAINRSGRLMFSNRLGEEMIHRAAWVRVWKGLLTPIHDVHAVDCFAAGLRRVSSGIGSQFMVTNSRTGAEAQVSMTPIPSDVDLGFLTSTPSSLVWITPIAPRNDVGHDMARLFDLTPAERRVLDKLIAGEDLRQAATLLRISIHTARTQLKSIFRKTGRRSQGQLLILAARIATLASSRS